MLAWSPSLKRSLNALFVEIGFLPKIDRALNFLIEEALLRDLFWCHSFDVRLVKIFIEAHKNKIVALGSYVLVCIIKV